MIYVFANRHMEVGIYDAVVKICGMISDVASLLFLYRSKSN